MIALTFKSTQKFSVTFCKHNIDTCPSSRAERHQKHTALPDMTSVCQNTHSPTESTRETAGTKMSDDIEVVCKYFSNIVFIMHK